MRAYSMAYFVYTPLLCVYADRLGHYKSHSALILIRLQAFLTLIFEGVAYGVKGGDGDKTTKKKRKKAKTLPFPNLTSIGLIEMAGCVRRSYECVPVLCL